MDSILNSVKQVLGLEETHTAFDVDILMHINSVFGVLHQIGIGPDEGLYIVDDAAVWSDFLGDDVLLNAAKTYVCLRVRLLFDPPETSYLIQAMEKQVSEIEWRLNVYREGKLHPLVVVV
jgi:hypothetical protein